MHSTNNNLNLRIKTKPITVGAVCNDICLVSMGQKHVNKCRTYSAASSWGRHDFNSEIIFGTEWEEESERPPAWKHLTLPPSMQLVRLIM